MLTRKPRGSMIAIGVGIAIAMAGACDQTAIAPHVDADAAPETPAAADGGPIDDGPANEASGGGGGADPAGGAGGGAGAGLPNGSMTGAAAIARSSGSLVVAGVLTGSVDLGKGSLTSAGGSDLVVAEFDQAGSVTWNRRYGGAGDAGNALVAVDVSGGTFVTTAFAGSLDLGAGALTSAGMSDVAVARLDATGATTWSRRFGDAAAQFPVALASDGAGGVLLGVHFATSAPNEGTSLLKLSSTGEPAWTKDWTDVEIRALAPTASGGTLVAGWFWRTVDFGGGPRTSAGLEDIFLLELDAAGTWIRDLQFGGSGSDRALGMAVDPGGDIFLTGAFDDTLALGSPALVSPRDPSRFAASLDVFVAELRAGGTPVWSRRFGDASSDQQGTSVAADGLGRVVVAGGVGGAIDFGLGSLDAATGPAFVALFDAAGQARWQTQLPALPAMVRTTPAGALLLVGSFGADTTFDLQRGRTLKAGKDAFLVELLLP